MNDAYLSVGNTNTYLTVIKNNQYKTASLIPEMNSLISENNINRIFIASVNQANEDAYMKSVHFTGQYISINKRENAIRSQYNIEQMGIDRYLCIFNAQTSHIFPSVIADLGTADTFDYLDGSGMHIGGLIMPGLQTLHKSLDEYTDRISLYEPQLRDIIAGKNTEESVTQGVYSQWLSGVINAIAMTKEISSSYTAIITGGNSCRVHDFIKGIYDKNFLVRGMKLYAENICNAE